MIGPPGPPVASVFAALAARCPVVAFHPIPLSVHLYHCPHLLLGANTLPVPVVLLEPEVLGCGPVLAVCARAGRVVFALLVWPVAIAALAPLAVLPLVLPVPIG
jgi:hypothetical protein